MHSCLSNRDLLRIELEDWIHESHEVMTREREEKFTVNREELTHRTILVVSMYQNVRLD